MGVSNCSNNLVQPSWGSGRKAQHPKMWHRISPRWNKVSNKRQKIRAFLLYKENRGFSEIWKTKQINNAQKICQTLPKNPKFFVGVFNFLSFSNLKNCLIQVVEKQITNLLVVVPFRYRFPSSREI